MKRGKRSVDMRRESTVRLREEKLRRAMKDPEKKTGKVGQAVEMLIRWGLVILLMLMIGGAFTSRNTSFGQTAALRAEIAEMEVERQELAAELERFADPEWRESYWKWRTMRHEPGEYYIDFVERGIL